MHLRGLGNAVVLFATYMYDIRQLVLNIVSLPHIWRASLYFRPIVDTSTAHVLRRMLLLQYCYDGLGCVLETADLLIMRESSIGGQHHRWTVQVVNPAPSEEARKKLERERGMDIFHDITAVFHEGMEKGGGGG